MEILLRQMDLWYAGTPGKLLVDTEMLELGKILAGFQGRHLLQMGGPSEVFLFDKSPIRHRVRISPEYSSVFAGPNVQGYFEELPFLPESLDVVLLPHILEFIPDPRVILKEVYTVLVPEGYVILLGFNPISLWGLNKVLRRHRHLPWRGHFWNIFQMKHWLSKQGFVIIDQKTIFFRPPLRGKEMLSKLLFLEAMGRLCWPSMGGIYLLVAQKKLHGLTPIKDEQLHPATLT